MAQGSGAGGTPTTGTGSGGTPTPGQPHQDPNAPSSGVGASGISTGGTPAPGSAQGVTPGAGQPSSSSTPAAPAQAEGETPDALKEALRKEREARKAAEKQRDELLPKSEREQAELERLRAQSAGWDNERARLTLERDVVATAQRMGYADPADAVALLERSTLLKKDDTGTPTNVEEALRKLLEQKPYLRASAAARPPGSAEGGPRGGANGGAGGGFDMNNWLRGQRGGGRSSSGSATE